MKVFVTGSSGFIGTALAQRLKAENCEVVGLDRHPGPATDIVCDILDAKALQEAVQATTPDALVHLAARIDIDENADVSAYPANVEGVRNVIEAVRRTPSIKRTIWTSSQLVCRVDYLPSSDTDYNPDSSYGRSKVLTEQIVREQDGGSSEWCLVRPTTVWGPGMSAHYQRFLRMIQRGYYFHVGSAPLLKSFSYVGNISYQYRQLLRASPEQVHRRTFYLADYEPLDLVAWGDAFQRALHARRIPRMPVFLARALAHSGDAAIALGLKQFPLTSRRLKNILTQYQFDLTATEAVCGPLPSNFGEGIEQTVEWFNSLSQPKT
ncbi:N-acetyl-alpha-D-glucosaminyl-diphospho-ditrans, octacis-undecaprenol 4-epimerase [Bradyrhizobium ivorense]|uniref:N-acetyl-alpha-D-glucosaminyl-diphospho-ditrans, octacis-undecaprenol 4-epimerase n=1 Tax=Bradyrhizobium ivorense TaxID=2511166 RepID=A0A508TQZ8_9BRAD|nr:NAD(P)-dependent oxidoreductase [Bradyrhizobium ivorense]VIO76723.1 N-acetyl-alpha-D-glucosaminyl-diphospho-ditrans, octacis-undecaprenol 4-epimerase [Bradyrhizobium ivorense]